jgi:hypothetical protein
MHRGATYPDGQGSVNAGRSSSGPGGVENGHSSALATVHRQPAQEASLACEAEGGLGGGMTQGTGEAGGH